MNIFFYAGSSRSEEQLFAEKLLKRESLADMVIMPGGGELISPMSLNLRGGDLVILCAATDESFNSLLSIHEKFEDFRIILILHRQDEQLVKKAHLLRPRYITYLTGNLNELDTVIEKMVLSKRIESSGLSRGEETGE